MNNIAYFIFFKFGFENKIEKKDFKVDNIKHIDIFLFIKKILNI